MDVGQAMENVWGICLQRGAEGVSHLEDAVCDAQDGSQGVPEARSGASVQVI